MSCRQWTHETSSLCLKGSFQLVEVKARFFWVSSFNEVTCYWDVTNTYCSGTLLVSLMDLFAYVSLVHDFSSMTWFSNVHIAEVKIFRKYLTSDLIDHRISWLQLLICTFYLSIFSCRMARVPPPCLTADVFRRSSGPTPPPPCTTRHASNSSRSLSGRA